MAEMSHEKVNTDHCAKLPYGDIRNRVRGVDLAAVMWANWLTVYDFDLVPNFRDCAGTDPQFQISCADGKFRRNMLYRCGALTAATGADIQKLRDDIGIRTYIDLRNGSLFNSNLEGAPGAIYEVYPPSPWPLDSNFHERPAPGERRRVHVNLFSDLQPKKLEPHLAWMAEQHFLAHVEAAMRGSESQRKIVEVLDLLIEERNYPIAFGCTAGKDRTGLIAVLVQKLLGANDKDIIEEYMVSNMSNGHLTLCWHTAKAVTSKRLKADHGDSLRDVMLELDKAQRKPISEAGVDRLLVHLSHAPHSIEQINKYSYLACQEGMVYLSVVTAMLKELGEQGGAAAYLAGIGFSEEKQTKLRDVLVEPRKDASGGC